MRERVKTAGGLAHAAIAAVPFLLPPPLVSFALCYLSSSPPGATLSAQRGDSCAKKGVAKSWTLLKKAFFLPSVLR